MAAKQVEDAQIEAAELLSLLNEHEQKLESTLSEKQTLEKRLSQRQKENDELKTNYRIFREKSTTHIAGLEEQLKEAKATAEAYKKLEISYLEQIAMLKLKVDR